jgi:energy-coupling factor transporter ATP-binding protein EcfA2
VLFAKIAEIRLTGVTVLLVEQNTRAALALADRAYVLVEGRNRYEGAAADLRRSGPGAALSRRSRRSRGGCRDMNLQFLADGLLIGAMIGLGAIGVTLTYAILRFANFAHGEFVAWGAYATWPWWA